MMSKSVLRLAGFFYALTIATGILGEMSHTALGLACQLLCVACYVVVTALLYEVFAPVDRRVSLLAAFFSLVGIAVLASSDVGLFSGALQSHEQGYAVADVFFGIYCVLIGVLIVRFRLISSIVGVLMMVAGASYLFQSFSDAIAPGFTHSVGDYLGLLGLIGEGALTVALLVPFAKTAPET